MLNNFPADRWEEGYSGNTERGFKNSKDLVGQISLKAPVLLAKSLPSADSVRFLLFSLCMALLMM